MKVKMLAVRVSEELIAKIDKKAEENGINRSAFVNMILTKAVRDNSNE